ncbi:hypothetical protein PsorP6_002743 [Peronosclerospora sorghi]|uniref:Uncharacterized protein n=1 Tax=Peronosclerospora sorghi TaxID=230839 RepID=A0ACC0WT51_9STRA|nr:hypothetical protein PsorP6_002743 [Peronosclerospora sorghi]
MTRVSSNLKSGVTTRGNSLPRKSRLPTQHAGVQLWFNGHTHGENHDYSSTLQMHFVTNGAGGGIQKESASGIPDFAKSSSFNATKIGGMATKLYWYIPIDGAPGEEC